MIAPAAATVFELPASLSATAPPEARGLARDEVRLLVAEASGVTHTRFHHLAAHLEPPDVVVVNTSATVAAALSGVRPDGRHVAVHLSSPLADASYPERVSEPRAGSRASASRLGALRSLEGESHSAFAPAPSQTGRGDSLPDRHGVQRHALVELRCENGSCRIHDGRVGERIALEAGTVTLRSAYPDADVRTGSRLWQATFDVPYEMPDLLARHGRPIRYGYVGDPWPLDYYQTVFAREAGSAEMPSAARPFSDRLVTDLVAAGIDVVPIMLHTGVSSLEARETPLPERFAVTRHAARRINHARDAGGRVVAVGTTVTRAVESAADGDGRVREAAGWTDLVIGPERGVRVVDGLVTGWHEPQASHLLLLEAVAGPDLVRRAYDAALAERYLWHEFGDSALLLPPPRES